MTLRATRYPTVRTGALLRQAHLVQRHVGQAVREVVTLAVVFGDGV